VQQIINFSDGKVEIKDGVVYYNGQAMHNVLTNRIIGLMREDFPFAPVVKFFDNLMQNPSSSSVNELYTFLEHRALPITEDGHFLAYKHVRDDWTDIWTGKIDNSVGKVVEIIRNQVDDDRNKGCSYGLHCGTIEYVKNYSGSGCNDGGHYIIVKVNPKDVVSVPLESNCTKLRTCRYEVLGIYSGDLVAPLYNNMGGPPTTFDDPEDEEEEYEDFDLDNEEEEEEEEDVLEAELVDPTDSDHRSFNPNNN